MMAANWPTLPFALLRENRVTMISVRIIFFLYSRLWLYSRSKPSSDHNVTPAKAPTKVETLGQLSGHTPNGFVPPEAKNGYALHAGKEFDLSDHLPRINGFTHCNGIQPTISLQPHFHAAANELGVTIIKVN